MRTEKVVTSSVTKSYDWPDNSASASRYHQPWRQSPKLKSKPLSLWIYWILLLWGCTKSFIKRSPRCRLYNYNDKDLALDINIQTDTIFDIICWIIYSSFVCFGIFATFYSWQGCNVILSAMSRHGYRAVSGRLLLFIKTKSFLGKW